MFEFLKKAMTPADKPSRTMLQSELGKHEIFASLTEQTRKDVLDLLAKANAVDIVGMLQQLRTMTANTRDQVVAKLLHPDQVQEEQQPQAEAKAEGNTYTVKPGDSLSKIAKAHNVPLKSILAANPQIKNPDLIHPRDVIHL